MALKLTLKPNEKVFIGGAVVQNGENPAELSILNDVPLLRGKDVLTEQDADSVCKQVYLCVQLMYMDRNNLSNYQRNYQSLIAELLVAVPATVPVKTGTERPYSTSSVPSAVSTAQARSLDSRTTDEKAVRSSTAAIVRTP